MANFWLEVKQTATQVWNEAGNWFASAAEHEVVALKPIAEQAVAQLTVAEAQALVSGNTKDTGHILAAVVNQTVSQAEKTGLSVGAAAILSAVGAAASNAPALQVKN